MLEQVSILSSATIAILKLLEYNSKAKATLSYKYQATKPSQSNTADDVKGEVVMLVLVNVNTSQHRFQQPIARD